MIARASKQVVDEKLRKEALSRRKIHNKRRSEFLSELQKLELEADQVEKTWTMMKRISVWDLTEVGQHRTLVSYVGTSAESCATVSFRLNNARGLDCNSTANPSILGHNHHPRLYPAKVAEYLSAKNEALCSSLNCVGQLNTKALKRALRSNAWTRCRLEAISSELRLLHRRYEASMEIIERRTGETNLVVHVKFSRVGSSVDLMGSFELSNAYPFGSLNTQLEQLDAHDKTEKEGVNLEELQDMLTRNARPGFCYLSRTLAVLSAFYRQTVGT